MPKYTLLPQPQGYGYEIGILLLDLVETHVPGDTAHAGSYDFPVIFKVVDSANVSSVTNGEKSVEPHIVAAAKELERMGVKAISSNCGFMLHFQEAVRNAVNVPVFLSSLLQLSLAARFISSGQKIAILTAFTERLTPEVLRLAGLPDNVEVVVNSIQNTPEFLNMQIADSDTDAFGDRLEEAADQLFSTEDNIGALLLECAVFTPYAERLRKKYALPVFDFISLIDYGHAVSVGKRSNDRRRSD